MATSLTERTSDETPLPVTPTLVVGVAVWHQMRLLVALRPDRPLGEAPLRRAPGGANAPTRSARVSGWEFPGGKCELGESAEQTAVREIGEELGCSIDCCGRSPARVRISAALELVIVLATLRSGTPRPNGTDHCAVAWCDRHLLSAIGLVDTNQPFVPDLLRAWPTMNSNRRP